MFSDTKDECIFNLIERQDSMLFPFLLIGKILAVTGESRIVISASQSGAKLTFSPEYRYAIEGFGGKGGDAYRCSPDLISNGGGGAYFHGQFIPTETITLVFYPGKAGIWSDKTSLTGGSSGCDAGGGGSDLGQSRYYQAAGGGAASVIKTIDGDDVIYVGGASGASAKCDGAPGGKEGISFSRDYECSLDKKTSNFRVTHSGFTGSAFRNGYTGSGGGGGWNGGIQGTTDSGYVGYSGTSQILSDFTKHFASYEFYNGHEAPINQTIIDPDGNGYWVIIQYYDCPEHCNECELQTISEQSQIICSKCETGYLLSDNICTSRCDPGQIFYQDECYSCSDITDGSCSECTLDQMTDKIHCSKCNQGFYYFEEACKSSCAELGNNYFIDGDKCSLCDVPNCQKCSTYGKCEKCNDKYVLNSETYQCDAQSPISSTISETFSTSESFTISGVFSHSFSFSSSADFTKSVSFSDSTDFTLSSIFDDSLGFTKSLSFSKSTDFQSSSMFSLSQDFTKSSRFTLSGLFSKSTLFTWSTVFTQSVSFTPNNTQEKFPTETVLTETITSDYVTNSELTQIVEPSNSPENKSGTASNANWWYIVVIICATIIILSLTILIIILVKKRKKKEDNEISSQEASMFNNDIIQTNSDVPDVNEMDSFAAMSNDPFIINLEENYDEINPI